MKWITSRKGARSAAQVRDGKGRLILRLFDNQGKAVALVGDVEGDFVWEASASGSHLGEYRDLEAALRAVHRVFGLPDFVDVKEIKGDIEPVR